MPVIYFYPSLTWLKQVKSILSLALVCFILTICLVATNIAQMIPAVFLIPFPAIGMKFQRRLARFWWTTTVVLLKYIYNYRVIYTGERFRNNESALMIANHLEQPDILVLLFPAFQFGILGYLTWFAKESLRHVPFLGWSMRLIGTIFVTSHWGEDRRRVELAFKRANLGPFPIWPVNFVEGSRITEKRLAASHKYAESHHLPKLQWVLLPRAKGFSATLDGLSSELKAIYDVTIGYPQGIPTLIQYLKGLVPVVHLHVTRFEVSAIPTSLEDRKEWLLKRYVEKDQLMSYFTQHLCFPASKEESDGLLKKVA